MLLQSMFFYIVATSLFVYFYPYNLKKEISQALLKFMKYDVSISSLTQSSIIVSSHTSMYDLLLGLCVYYSHPSPFVLYLCVKKEMEMYLTPLFSLLDSNVKCIPIDPFDKYQTDVIQKRVEHHSLPFLLYISPEGTERCTDKIHKGFWYLSKHLQIPITYLGMDYYLKKVELSASHSAYALWAEEEKKFIENCSRYIPLYPECFYWTKDFYKMNGNSMD